MTIVHKIEYFPVFEEPNSGPELFVRMRRQTVKAIGIGCSAAIDTQKYYKAHSSQAHQGQGMILSRGSR